MGGGGAAFPAWFVVKLNPCGICRRIGWARYTNRTHLASPAARQILCLYGFALQESAMRQDPLFTRSCHVQSRLVYFVCYPSHIGK